MFQAVVFDIGETLVGYDKPLSWSGLYRPALEYIAEECKFNFTENDYQYAIDILAKYNTRINPREYEVSSTQIFEEIVFSLNLPVKNIDDMINQFFTFFRRESFVYPEVEGVLIQLLARGIKIGTLSGDEEKDMVCANAAGAYSVLINRGMETKEYGQKAEVSSLHEVLDIIDSGRESI